MLGFDYNGLAAVIGAIAACITAIGMAFARKPMLDTHKAVTWTNGDERPLGEIAAATSKAVGATPPAEPPAPEPPATP